MSAISDFAAKQTAFNKRQGDAIDKSVASISAVTDDIARLNKTIADLQASNGTVTPADQALIDDLESQGDALSTKVESVATALQALDDLTPPTPPTA